MSDTDALTLERIRALRAGITPGTWEAIHVTRSLNSQSRVRAQTNRSPGIAHEVLFIQPQYVPHFYGTPDERVANLAFVAAAPAAIDVLLAEVGRLEAVIETVRRTCQDALDLPIARRGSYIYAEYRPYEDILDLVDPEASVDPATCERHMAEYAAWLPSSPADTFIYLLEWHAQAYPDCPCMTFRRQSERNAAPAPTEGGKDEG